jgi:hypothetical protein
LHAFETKTAEVQLFNENIDHAYRVVLGYAIVQKLGQQPFGRRRSTGRAVSERPAAYMKNQIQVSN